MKICGGNEKIWLWQRRVLKFKTSGDEQECVCQGYVSPKKNECDFFPVTLHRQSSELFNIPSGSQLFNIQCLLWLSEKIRGKEVYNPGLHSKLLVIFVLQTCGTQQTWVYWHSDITTLDYLWVWCLSAYTTHTYNTLAQYRSEFLFPFLTNSQVTETNTFWQKKIMHTTFINYKLPYWKTLDSEYFLTMNLQQCMVYQLEMVCQDFFWKGN